MRERRKEGRKEGGRDASIRLGDGGIKGNYNEVDI